MANQSIGALWLKTGARGEFMSGNIEIDGVKHDIVVFPNSAKQPGERSPDWRILPSQPRDQGNSRVPQGAPQVTGYRRPTQAVELDDQVPW